MIRAQARQLGDGALLQVAVGPQTELTGQRLDARPTGCFRGLLGAPFQQPSKRDPPVALVDKGLRRIVEPAVIQQAVHAAV